MAPVRMLSRAVVATLAALALPILATAQTPVRDVGLTLDFGPWLPAFVGYDCGTFSCTPLQGGGYGVGAQRTFTAFGMPNTPYAIAVGAGGPCTPLPGFGNSLLLAAPIATLHVGMIGPLVAGLTCRQGMDRFAFTMPPTAPAGVALRFQSVGVGTAPTGGAPVLALGPAIDVVVR